MPTQTTSIPVNTVELDAAVLVRRAWTDEKASAGTSLQRWMLIADYLARGRAEHRGNVQFNRFLVASGLDDMDPTTRADAIKLGKLLPLSEALISTLTEAGCAHPSVVLPRVIESAAAADRVKTAKASRPAPKARPSQPHVVTSTDDLDVDDWFPHLPYPALEIKAGEQPFTAQFLFARGIVELSKLAQSQSSDLTREKAHAYVDACFDHGLCCATGMPHDQAERPARDEPREEAVEEGNQTWMPAEMAGKSLAELKTLAVFGSQIQRELAAIALRHLGQ